MSEVMAVEDSVQQFDVSVVIPHYAGSQVYDCLESVLQTPDQPREIILVDDASTDGTAEIAAERYPSIRVVRNERNLGFVGACNRGIATASSRYVVLLNDDAIVESGWLSACVSALEADPTLAAVQPKIVQADDPSHFEYAGAAGGLIDRFGYPFALGRWFEHVERDSGQYDEPRDIFWASGVAMVFRRSVSVEIGALDPVFVMHMEEIDWCWRAWIAGYRVQNVPSAKVRHIGAKTLTSDSFRKMYLNHRNSVLMLLKNTDSRSLLSVIPTRLALELLTCVGALITGRFARAAAAIAGTCSVAGNLGHIRKERARIASFRKRTSREFSHVMYRRSIALRYLCGKPAPHIQLHQRNGGSS